MIESVKDNSPIVENVELSEESSIVFYVVMSDWVVFNFFILCLGRAKVQVWGYLMSDFYIRFLEYLCA